jgi:hypothetical protein
MEAPGTFKIKKFSPQLVIRAPANNFPFLTSKNPTKKCIKINESTHLSQEMAMGKKKISLFTSNRN